MSNAASCRKDIEDAERHKHVVLIICDPQCLNIERYQLLLREYDKRIFDNTGMICVGESSKRASFEAYLEHSNQKNTHYHCLEGVNTRDDYVAKVHSIVTAIANKLNPTDPEHAIVNPTSLTRH